MTRSIGLVAGVALLFAAAADANDPGKKHRTPPQEFGRVVLNNHSQKAKMAPVLFEHWLHRAKYTCRVCHVDIGFAMAPGATNVRAADNAKGMYCGACQRCHSVGTAAVPEYDFATFTKGLPKGRFGNGVDWEAAELAGLIKPSDYVAGVSIKRASMAVQKDFALTAKLQGMPDIVFSHAKHTVWSGCEGCHPELFGVKKGTTKYTMVEIFEGKYCGACHLTVAFPTNDCQRCHTKPVQ